MVVFILVALFAADASARQSSLVFTLSPGPYAVGFRSVNQYDFSRTFARYSPEGTLINEGGLRRQKSVGFALSRYFSLS